MSKKKSTRRRVTATPRSELQPVGARLSPVPPSLGELGGLQHSGIALGGIALRSLTYRELEGVEPHDANAAQMALSIELTGGLLIRTQPGGANVIELSLDLTVKPDPQVKPIEVHAVMSALFSGDRPLGDIARFVNTAGTRVLFPYLRELVSAATGRGIYGPVFLDPVSVGSLVSEGELAAIIADHARNANGNP